jgi:hypothetical protein
MREENYTYLKSCIIEAHDSIRNIIAGVLDNETIDWENRMALIDRIGKANLKLNNLRGVLRGIQVEEEEPVSGAIPYL